MTHDDLSEALMPLLSRFSFSQLESVLYAFLPTRFEHYLPKTGIYAVDTFVITALVTSILATLRLFLFAISKVIDHVKGGRLSEPTSHRELSIVIEPMASQDDFHSTPNIFYQALSHLISKGVQTSVQGSYSLKPNLEIDHNPLEPPFFNVIPQPGQPYSLTDGRSTFHIVYQTHSTSGPEPLGGGDKPASGHDNKLSTEPAIKVSVVAGDQDVTTVSTLSDFLNRVARDYLLHLDSLQQQTRSRYDYAASGKWIRICSLYKLQGLQQAVALSLENEALIAKDLEMFSQNKDFYKRIGAPYVRGYMFHGRPGTGKTSLVFAIASNLKRDLYFINLSYIDSDSELFQAFSSVPANSIVVFEDVDSMTDASARVLHRRDSEGGTYCKSQNTEPKFNLSMFLSILDGHTMEDGIIFIMTTNHPQVLDPAVIRPGRMDVRLEMTYATHYQMRRMYKMVLDDDDDSTLDEVFPGLEDEIPEFLLPPSEVMQLMILCRKREQDIPGLLINLVKNYNSRSLI